MLVIWARRIPETLRTAFPPLLVSGFFLFRRAPRPDGVLGSQLFGQLHVAHFAHLMPLQHLHHAFVGLGAGEFREQQALDESKIYLDHYASLAFGKPMAAGNQAFEPAEKHLHLPTVMIEADDLQGAEFIG